MRGYFHFFPSFLCLCVYFLPSLHTILLLGHCLVLIVELYVGDYNVYLFASLSDQNRMFSKPRCRLCLFS